MGYRNATVSSTAPVTTSVSPTLETVVFTAGPLNLITDTAQVLIFWYVLLTAGTGSTGTRVRLRRGSTTSDPLVNTTGIASVAAGSTYALNGSYVDFPALGAEVNYSVSFQMASASGAGTVLEGCLTAMVL